MRVRSCSHPPASLSSPPTRSASGCTSRCRSVTRSATSQHARCRATSSATRAFTAASRFAPPPRSRVSSACPVSLRCSRSLRAARRRRRLMNFDSALVTTTLPSPLSACLALLAGWLCIGCAGLVRPASVRFAGRMLFPLGAVLGLALAVVAAASLLGADKERLTLPLGLPDLPFHLRLDPLSIAFLLAMLGFGAKAGLVPLHVWLPEAHPAAPSPVSALMSGVMLKLAVYGVLRVSFDLLGEPPWWWGLLPLVVGLFTAFYGVVFAAVQTDMKRLLAYSSIENIGLAFTGLGLSIVFLGAGMRLPGALAFIATLYHCLNHALMKSLLFLGTGSVLHATGQRNLGRLGGLIHRMPWVAWLTLVGALAIAGPPPLNGFVSEWLLLQSFLFADQIPHSFINML